MLLNTFKKLKNTKDYHDFIILLSFLTIPNHQSSFKLITVMQHLTLLRLKKKCMFNEGLNFVLK